MNYLDAKTPMEFYQYMKENIRYGFMSKGNNKSCFRKDLGDELYEKLLMQSYFLQTPEELIIHKCGICYDYVELERSWFLNHGYLVYTYFTSYHNHTILIYQEDEKYYFFERSFKELNGIYEFDCLDDALNFYLQRQISCSTTKIDNMIIYPYDTVIFGCGFREFIENIKTNHEGKILKLKI